tara:strand:+ start:332 stop:820 length:489 start_codon:yes stop_codon:yes gene_type:complete
VSHGIKQRKKANDVFITPLELAKNHINMIEYNENDLWLDPCKNNGSYYNQYPSDCQKDYCEILEGKDFFEYQGNPSIICDNPPYSILDNWFKKVIELNPRVYSCLIGVGNLTARRIEWFKNAGYGITKLKMLKVWKWYGMSYIVVFEKNKPSIIDIDRKVYK